MMLPASQLTLATAQDHSGIGPQLAVSNQPFADTLPGQSIRAKTQVRLSSQAAQIES